MSSRFDDYIDYHINGDSACNNVLLRYWADKHCLTLNERFLLAYFFSLTYCVSSAIYLFKQQEQIFDDVELWASKNKKDVLFQSDRKYIGIVNRFENCLNDFKSNIKSVDNYLSGVIENGAISLEKALNKTKTWEQYGRFAAYLFLETFIALTDYNITNTLIDWKHGDTATSGIMNLYEYDGGADYFDKYNKLPIHINEKYLDKMLLHVLKKIKNKGGNDSVVAVETSLCAFRKFIKGTRYNGYYLDRQLEEINKTKNINYLYQVINDELLKIRKILFDNKYLGEINGWVGIRKEMKKIYKENGEKN